MIFVVTAAYAAVFGLMRSLDSGWPLQVFLITLLTLVGLIQMFAPDSMVRAASILTGISCVAVMFVAMIAIEGHGDMVEIVSEALCYVLGFGSFLGYGAGVLVSGVFLLTDYVRRWFGLAP